MRAGFSGVSYHDSDRGCVPQQVNCHCGWKECRGRMGNSLGVFYPESRFGGFTDVDGTIAFYIRVNALLKSTGVVLDVGCGRGAWQDDPVPVRRQLRDLRGKCGKVIGIDVDPAGASNPFLEEFRLIEGPAWPVPDDSIDLCVCDSVLEHIAEGEAFFDQFARVLRPDGFLCIRTSNKLSYVALLARLIPDRFHASLLQRACQGRTQEKDVFPTLYRCNTTRRLKSLLSHRGFEHCVCGYDAEPSYLALWRMAYRAGMICSRVMPGMFKSTLFAFARKISGGRAGSERRP